jgi:hypothetical protein
LAACPGLQGDGDAVDEALGELEPDAEAEDEGDAESEVAAPALAAGLDADVDDPPSAWAAVAVSSAAGMIAAVAAAVDNV